MKKNVGQEDDSMEWHEFTVNNGRGKFCIENKTLIHNGQTYVFQPIWEETAGRLYIIFSTACNLRCVYCFQRGLDKMEVPLDQEVIFSYIKQLRNEISEIVLFGGEPLLKSNFSVIQAIFQEFDHLKFIIFTNGNFDKEYVELLEEYSYAIQAVVISLDGPKKIHNKRRVNPQGDSYENIVRNLIELANRDVTLDVQINVDLSNADQIGALFDEMIKDPVLRKLDYTINPVKYIQNDISFVELFSLYFSMVSTYQMRIFVNNRLITNLQRLLSHQPLSRNRCHLQSTYVLSLPDNEIYACPQNPISKIGEINASNELLIDKSSIEKMVKQTTFNRSPCITCSVKDICPYGCPFVENPGDCKAKVDELLDIVLSHFDLLLRYEAI